MQRDPSAQYRPPLQDAIDATRAQLRNGIGALMKARIGEAATAALTARGLFIKQRDPWSIRVERRHGITIEHATGVMTGAADPRRDGVHIAPPIAIWIVEKVKPVADRDLAQQQ